MFKKIKTLFLTTMMAPIFPAFGADSPAGTPADMPSAPPAAPPAGPAAKISEMEKRLAGKTEELEQANARIAEMEKTGQETGSQIAALTESLKKSRENLEDLTLSLKKAVTGYKDLMLQANPEILPELITGESFTDLDASLVKAKELTGRIRENLRSEIAGLKIPAGAPQRGGGDTSGLSAREKIREGLERR